MLKSISVSNYKSFNSATLAEFGANWTVVVGQNNSGKTSLLRACDVVRSGPVPYRGSSTDPTIPPRQFSEVKLEFFAPGKWLGWFLSQGGSSIALASDQLQQSSVGTKEQQVLGVVNETISSGGITISGAYKLGSGIEITAIVTHKGYRVFPGNAYTRVEVNGPERQLFAHSGNFGASEASYHGLVATYLSQSVYLFAAERLYVGAAQPADTLELASNASNLAQVVNRLRQQRYKFESFINAVRQVLPTVTDIVPSVNGSGQVEIRISQHDPKTNREDLNFSLLECGTGIQQVLAILFVAMTSDSPRTIIIDEPNSFLHPGASKKLLQILKQYPQHQYIISTHSPELIDAADPEILLHIEWNQSGSQVKRIDRADLNQTRNALADLGVSLSDVFSADQVIWVEGPTEERCFKEILRYERKPVPTGVSILPVRSTDELKGKHKRAFFEIYQRTTQGSSLLPVDFCFAFDSEGLSEKDKNDLNRASGNRFTFLPRKTFENYLIHPRAIANVLRRANDEQVVDFLNSNGNEKKYGAKESWNGSLQHPRWLSNINGALLLQDLFRNVTNNETEYRKVTHGFEILTFILENDPEHIVELKNHVLKLITA